MVRYILASLMILGSLPISAQKQAVELEAPEENIEQEDSSTEVAKSEDSEASVIVSAPETKDLLKLDLDLFNKMDRPIPLVALLKRFESLQCKSSFATPLNLTCFTCGVEHENYQWIFEFSKNAVGGELCDLSRVQRVSRNSSDFEKAKEQFKENLAKKYSVDWTSVTNLDSAATKDKDFQVIQRQSFDLDKNDFVDEQVLQLSFLSYMMNQSQINQAKENWQRARMSFSKAAWNDFGTYLFSEDSGELQSKYIQVIQELMTPKEQMPIGPKLEPSDPLEIKRLQKAKYLPLIRSLVFYYDGKNNVGLKETYYQLFQLLPKLKLTQEESKYFEGFKFLKVEKIEESTEGKEESLAENKEDDSKVESESVAVEKTEEKKEENETLEQPVRMDKFHLVWTHELAEKEQKNQIPIFAAMKNLSAETQQESLISCSQREQMFLDQEKAYQEFYKGKEDVQYYKMYRSYLVVHLLELSEMKYFEFLNKQKKLVEQENPNADMLKKYSEKLEESLARIEDYSEELQQLMPYLEESIRLRKEWLLRGIKSSEVFAYCVEK